ncbi:uncharacterized protein [Gossypium hirsutum]|uniref:Gag-Pol polyprotein n=1 Tax=Gossypium hirsutum TaxID=3635 RepID=A0A1U8IAQ0_GOSHI|nr:uncharacterized protein LOC107894553 [Gossypium hirsutum]
MPRGIDFMRFSKTLVDKIQKQGAEKFRANTEDDAERAEIWLENSIRVFNELSCTPEECLKCAISLLRDDAYHWWKTLISGRMSISEYEREFVQLSKYARKCVPTEAKMFRRFEDGLNEDIRVLVGIIELKEFFVLVEGACKAEKLTRGKKKAESEARDMRKRMMSRSTPTQSKKSKDVYSRSYALAGRSHGNCKKKSLGFRTQATSVASIGDTKCHRPEYEYYGRRHPGSCRRNDGMCYRCGSQCHFINDYPETDGRF